MCVYLVRISLTPHAHTPAHSHTHIHTRTHAPTSTPTPTQEPTRLCRLIGSQPPAKETSAICRLILQEILKVSSAEYDLLFPKTKSMEGEEGDTGAPQEGEEDYYPPECAYYLLKKIFFVDIESMWMVCIRTSLALSLLYLRLTTEEKQNHTARAKQGNFFGPFFAVSLRQPPP